jgi:murein DD-endopeptidase MepM/ murein hydrolase activator NlpD
VAAAGDGAMIAEYAGDGLAQRLLRVGVRDDAEGAAGLAPGRRGVIYIELALPSGAAPSQIVHRVEYGAAGEAHASVMEGASVAISEEAAPVLGAPLRGGPWAAVYHPSWPRGHRRVFYTLDGRARIPGRFAIDFMRVNAQGAVARGDGDLARDHLGYGEDVLAVADATVASVRDGMEESVNVSGNPRHALADEAGNHIVLRLSAERCIFYEHLRAGSIRVGAGERVRRGQVIASLGFSGSSNRPHLHFHVADGPSPLGAEGRPFAFDRFEWLGQYDDIAMLGRERWRPAPASHSGRRQNERPAPNAVVQFER